MTTLLESPAKDASPKEPLPLKKVLESVALALEGRGKELLLGMEAIETRDIRELLFGPAKLDSLQVGLTVASHAHLVNTRVDGTIFGAIAEELEELGLGKHQMLGQVATSLGIDINDEDNFRQKMNFLGCWCNGEVVSALKVADRVRYLIQ